jgi:hypothetical protein
MDEITENILCKKYITKIEKKKNSLKVTKHHGKLKENIFYIPVIV